MTHKATLIILKLELSLIKKTKENGLNNANRTYWRAGWPLQSWTLQGKLSTGGGGGKDPGECGLAGKIQFLRGETGSEGAED